MDKSVEHHRGPLQKLIFIHIPKTAGLSLHHELENHFGRTASVRFGSEEDRARFMQLSSEELHKFTYVTGHLSLTEVRNMGIDYPAVAVVREPIERLVSLLRYHRESTLSAHQHLKFDSFESFADHLAGTGQHNMQCWHICGSHKFQDAVDMIHRNHLYVAPLEYYDDFLKTLSDLLGNNLQNIRMNITPKNRPVTVTDADRRLLHPLVSEDEKLIAYIRKNYDALKREFIDSAITDPRLRNAIAKQPGIKEKERLAPQSVSASSREADGKIAVSDSSPGGLEAPRIIAFYLPQYHPIPENDEWWGRGFTEWRNVTKAESLFPGHYQPHIPAQLGFYDLRLEETRIDQAELARAYGMYGFCYYHYWFNGRMLLERPLEEVFASGKPDFPFCICWANENWTRRWDGEDQQVLMMQHYSIEDDRLHIRDLFRFFEDKRYIRVDGKPLFLVYRTENMPNPSRTAEVWREEARKAGIGELHLCRVESIGKCDPASINFDSAVEFAPDWANRGPRVQAGPQSTNDTEENNKNPGTMYKDNYIHTYQGLADAMMAKSIPGYPWFRCVTPSWDNSARRREGAVVFIDSTPERYQHWLESAIRSTKSSLIGDKKIVFINAWNEWAEGNHLEPDQKFGRAYLEATRKALENSSSEPQPLAESAVAVSRLTQRVAEFERQVSEKGRILAERERQLEKQEELIRILMTSLSWRITSPLRWGYKWIAQLKNHGK